ncbi:hypothetical protein D7Z26_08190 [Cohnella endophytica]|uniref:DUF3679 domain-containing protein n=1 Tax=Cohnella endophytica TaxID=2419778 RepID=A0A494XX84_9BACL|nr:hypothetical protein [Cohnella endophytica]RKP55187.1 hypothetical protein D7Z26_08190 [Cohnella endophytica]
MRRDTFKLLIFAGIIGFAILYGMELSSKGIADVNGPMSTGNPAAGEETTANSGDWTLPVTDNGQKGPKTAPSETKSVAGANSDAENPYDEGVAIPRDDREPIVDRVSGKTGEVLHDLSRNGIRIVVSLFDRVLG